MAPYLLMYGTAVALAIALFTVDQRTAWKLPAMGFYALCVLMIGIFFGHAMFQASKFWTFVILVNVAIAIIWVSGTYKVEAADAGAFLIYVAAVNLTIGAFHCLWRFTCALFSS